MPRRDGGMTGLPCAENQGASDRCAGGDCVQQSPTKIRAEKNHPLNTSSDLSSSSASSALDNVSSTAGR